MSGSVDYRLLERVLARTQSEAHRDRLGESLFAALADADADEAIADGEAQRPRLKLVVSERLEAEHTPPRALRRL